MATQLLDALAAGQLMRARDQELKANELALRAAQRQEEQRPLENRLAQVALGQRRPVAPGTPGMKAEPQDQQSALMELVALNPELGAKVQEAGFKLAADAQTRAENQAKALSGFLQTLSTLPVEQRAAARDMFLQNPVAQAMVDNQIMRALAVNENFSDAKIMPMVAGAGGQADPVNYTFREVEDANGNVRVMGFDPRNPGRPVDTGQRGVTPERRAARITATATAAPAVPPTKATANSLQSSIVTGDAMLSNLNAIKNDYKPEFLRVFGGQGTLAQWFNRARDRSGVSPLSEAQRKSLAGFTALRTRTERAFNAYRKEITGAAAALAELDRLKQSFLNTDMSPTEFETALNDYQSELLRVRRLYMDLMRQGFTDFGEGGDGAAALDAAYVGGADADGSARAGELRAQGMADEDIADRLEIEGYN